MHPSIWYLNRAGCSQEVNNICWNTHNSICLLSFWVQFWDFESLFWIFHIFGKKRDQPLSTKYRWNNSFSFKLSLKILLVSGNRSLTWTRYLNIEVPRWALLDPVNESLWSRHDIQKPVGVKRRCDVAYKKVEVAKKWEYYYHTVTIMEGILI